MHKNTHAQYRIHFTLASEELEDKEVGNLEVSLLSKFDGKSSMVKEVRW